MSCCGDEIHGEVSSADASTGAAVTLYDSGSVSSRTLKTTERLVISTISFRIEEGVTAVLAANTDAAGRRVAFLSSGVGYIELNPPYVCPRGVVPSVIASGAGDVDVVVQGYIQKV